MSKAPAHQPGGTWTPALAVVGASSRACKGGRSVQGEGTQAWADLRSCLGGGWCVMKGPRGGLQSPRPGHTSLG